MPSEGLPVYSPIAVPAVSGEHVPKLVMSDDYQRYFSQQNREIQESARRKQSVLLANQAATISATSVVIGDLPAGMYRVLLYAQITRAAGASSSLTPSIHWTSNGQSLSYTGAAMTGNALTEVQGITLAIRSDATGPIQYSTAYSSSGSPTMQYLLQVVVEQIVGDSV